MSKVVKGREHRLSWAFATLSLAQHVEFLPRSGGPAAVA